MDLKAMGVRISRMRDAAGLSQDDLAANSGVARGAVQQIERGTGNPTIKTLLAIAKALEISFEELTGHTSREALVDTMARASAQDRTLLDAGKLLQAIAKVSAPRRALILAAAHKDDRYLEVLPAKIAQAFRDFLKVL